MKKTEARQQVAFSKWLTYVYKKTGVFELKSDRGRGNIPFSEVQEHQLISLTAAAGAGIAFKIPDDSRSYKPFDCFYATEVDAFVVACFGNRFYLVRVSRWIDEAGHSKRRSLTEERAEAIAEVIGTIGSTDFRTKIVYPHPVALP